MAAQPAILDWQGVLAADAAMVGGKAWQLARLKQFGLPVPEGLVIPVGWCPPRMGAAILPPELPGALQAALAARDWLNKPLAVRSSAAGEDSAKASFAGIYRSCLNVCGMEQVQAAIREVWASLWSPAATAYRQKLGLGTGDTAPGMAVIIMPLLPAIASGIAFTCDPISGRDDRLVIHAQWGLGEALVGGQTDGDEYVFAEDPLDDHWALLHRRMGGKAAKAVTRPDGGTAMVPVPAGEAGAFVLSSAQASHLAELLRDAAVALDFIHPFYDLEWVWDGDRFWLTQGRPVTARPHYTYAPLQTQPTYWTRGNTCEVVPEPLSAIDWSNSRKLVNSLLTRGYLLAGYPVLPGAQRAGLFHGRLYLALSLLQWECFDALGFDPKAVNTLIGGHQPEIAVPAARLGDRLARWRRVLRYALRSPAQRRRGMRAVERAMIEAGQWRKQLPPGNAEELRREILRQFRAGRGAVDLFFLQGSGGGSLSMLVEQLDSYFPGEGHALGTALLAGGAPSVTARQGYELMALARLSREIASRESHGASPCRPRDRYRENPEFQQAFDRFLEHYGHRGLYETYFRNPRWREAPEYLLSSLAQLAQVDEAALRARQQAAVAEALARIKAGVPFWKRSFIEGLAKAARQECNQREAARSALVAYMEPERQLLLAAGRYLAGLGALLGEADIFQLMLSEILRALGGDIPAAGVRARVAERNEWFERWSRETAPDVLVEAAQHSTPGWQASALAPVNDSLRYQGIPTGTGRARGKVRLLRHPSEGYRLQPGDILVAPSTDPGWTPLFLSAGGLVVETGGYLSHGAIVAREFGIPAVVNLPGILARIKDGDMVEVDGTSGVVTLLERCDDSLRKDEVG